MIYTFTSNFFQGLDDSMTNALDKLWHNIKDRHILYLTDIETIESSSWYDGLRESNQKELQNLFINSANIPKKSNKITISSNSSENEYTLSEAAEILVSSAKVILENVQYDAYFLDKIISLYPKWGEKIEEHKKKGWLEYLNGGGENIQNVIAALKERFERQKSFIFPKESYKYIKAFILLDSDKTYPNDPTVKSLQTIVSASGFSFRILAKREKENYLPIEIYSEIPDNEKFIAAVGRLNSSPNMLDFFDLEKGFPDKNFTQLDLNIQALYRNLSDADKQTFRKEKLTFYKQDRKKDSFKSRFSELFLSQRITKENLEQRASSTGKDELQEILQKIYDLL